MVKIIHGCGCGRCEWCLRREITTLSSQLSEAIRERDEAREREKALLGMAWMDKPLPEDEAIHAAHPLKTGVHDTYMEALRMVSAKHSKYELVDLVNWLLSRLRAYDQTKG